MSAHRSELFGAALAAALAVMTGLWAGAASATTITFGAVPDEGTALSDPNGGTLYQEAGFTVTGLSGVVAWFTNPGFAHIDDSGTSFTSALNFSAGGGTFDAVGFSLLSFGYDYIDPAFPVSDNILVTGYNGSGLVASAFYTLAQAFGTVQDILLGSQFAGLTSFVIEILYADPAGNGCAPCAHFDLDSVTFANVALIPLPAPALLMGAGLIALGGLRVRRRVRKPA